MSAQSFRPFLALLIGYLKEVLWSSGFENDGEGESSWAAPVVGVGVGTAKWSGNIFNFLGVLSSMNLSNSISFFNKDPTTFLQHKFAFKTNMSKTIKKDYTFGDWTKIYILIWSKSAKLLYAF